MRRLFIAGNWKMNLLREDAVALAEAVAAKADTVGMVDFAVCPPSVYLDAVGQALRGSKVGLGAQNMYHEAKGAFTGELSAAMLLDVGCQYVILGHSERRHILGETDLDVNRKVKAAIAAGLSPIVCVGETLAQREAEETLQLISSQFRGSLADLTEDDMQKVVIAYEPVWAIGTGRTASPEQAEQVHADLRQMLKDQYNTAVADTVRIQYGGSVNEGNAASLLSQPNIDGALVGGASLKADSFLAIAIKAISG